jgi:hypothetical protein
VPEYIVEPWMVRMYQRGLGLSGSGDDIEIK